MNRFGVLNLFIAIALVASVTAIDCNTRPDFKDVKECCPNDGFATSEILEKCASLKEEKVDNGGKSGRGHGPPGHNACYGECVMNETGLVNFETMVVDEAKMKTFLTKSFSASPDFIQPYSDAITKCTERGKEMHEMRKNDPRPSPPPGSCKPCASMLMHCVKMEITINCPTSAWKNDEKCNNIRDFMMSCKPQHKGPKP